MKRFLGYLACLVLGAGLMAFGGYVYSRHESPRPSVKADTCLLEECLHGLVTYPIDQLTDAERVTLIEMGLEQRRLEEVMGAFVERLGSTMQPFAGAWRIQQRQMVQLKGVFDKYGVPEPKVSGSLGEISATSVRAACTQALDQTRHFQERLFNEQKSFGSRPDIRRYMQESAQLARDTVMPAFERCAKQE